MEACAGTIEGVLKGSFGLEDFRPAQREVVQALLAGRSVLAVLPTGAGKSLCYQLPAVRLPGVTLVVSPLLALMKDQVDALGRRDIRAARMDSTLDAGEATRVMEAARSGALKLLYVAAERFANEHFVRSLGKVRVSMVAIDESHCISEWGHNFRPDYLKLARWTTRLGLKPVLALTATATPEVARDIREAFGIAECDHYQTGLLRANLHYRMQPTPPDERHEALQRLLHEDASAPTIVYTTLQRTAEEVAGRLQRVGYKARPYHAGLDAAVRAGIQDDFLAGRLPMVVATIAFGMGIDKPDIRRVVHYNLPGSIEAYMQESGRAGRDGLPAVCALLADDSDRLTLENFSHGDMPDEGALRKMVFHILDQSGQFDVSLYELSVTYDTRQLVVATALAYLDLDGLIESVGMRYAGCRFRLLEPRDKLLAGYDAKRRQFLEALFAQAKEGRTWLTLETDAAAEALGCEPSRVSAALGDLVEAGSIELQPSGLRHVYRRVAEHVSKSEVATRLVSAFQARLERDLDRVQRVVDFVHGEGCISRRLAAHFGEQSSDCGTCGFCRGEAVPRLRWVLPEVCAQDVARMAQVSAEGHAALRSPRQMARFLCGISSPATIQAHLTRDGRFGCLAHVPFLDVLAQVI